jgi:hypothetical protein
VPEEGFEPSRPCEQRILSPSCLPFHHSGERCEQDRMSCSSLCCHSLRSRSVLQFVVGVVVGASIVALAAIVIAPSRRVRAEPPLPREVEYKLLLGEDPDQPTSPPAPSEDHPAPYSPSDLAELRRLSIEHRSRRKR